MKKTAKPKKSSVGKDDDLSSEYRFNYGKARPNRFASRTAKDQVMVVLESDVAQVFSTPEAVNHALRALIAAMPTNSESKRTRTSNAKS